MMNLKAEARNKPHSASFTSLQINESFHHFRSVSYFEAVTNASISGSRKSFETMHDKPRVARMPSNSTPCTPKKIEISKYSTLPVGNGITFPSKKTRSSSLSSFFRKFRPKFHRSSSDSKNPWIVIEFAPHDGNSDDASSDSDKSDHSIEQAVQSKAQHFTSLKDLHHHGGGPCNCPLRKDSNDLCNSPLRKDSSHSCNCSLRKDSSDLCNCPLRKDSNEPCNCLSTKDNGGSCNCPLRKDGIKCNLNSPGDSVNSRFRSENSLFFRLSPRRRIENLKHMLKNLSSKRRRKFRTSTSLHSLGNRSCAYRSEGCLKLSGGAYPSFSQVEHGRASSPVFHFCRPPKQDNLLSLRHSTDISYLLKIPNSRSSNASLSSVLEDSSFPRRAQPPTSLSLCAGDQQSLYRKMASVESIGACSLDFEASGAEFCAKDLTASECTLHSNGVAASVHEDSEQRESFDKLNLSNGFNQPKQECTVAEIKLPSYVSISCAINGYPNYSRFCRSRDNSPARTSFRKSSLEPSMLADTSREESYAAHRYSRSKSDCNGSSFTESKRINNGSVFTESKRVVVNNGSVFTESKRVVVNKQIQIPLKTGKRYTTEVTFSNGSVIREVSENGHESLTDGSRSLVQQRIDSLVLAKEVSSDGTKSLVQQRIESLYGKSVGDDVQVRGVGKGKDAQVNGAESSITSRSPTPNGKNHIGSVSPPVFRHLNKDFRKQLQINIPKKSDSTTTKSTAKLQNNVVSKELLPKKENGFSSVSNGVGHDECDRMKSMTPPPLKSKSIIEDKPSPSPTEGDGEGYRFLTLIDLEKEKIQAKVRVLEEELAVNSASIPEEASGKIRAACGKANLLITQKFEQFRGLCWKHIEENPSVPFYTTASDLAGFWDLVMLQVDDIDSTFKEIDAMRGNDWKEVLCEKPAMPVTRIRHSNPNAVSKSNPTTPKRSAKSVELTKAREEARRQLLAAKKKGRQQAASKEEEDIAIFAPTSS